METINNVIIRHVEQGIEYKVLGQKTTLNDNDLMRGIILVKSTNDGINEQWQINIKCTVEK